MRVLDVDSFANLIRKASRRMAADHEIDAGLGSVAATVENLTPPGQAAEAAVRLLRRRARSLREASDDLQRVVEQIQYISNILPLTGAGWPQVKAELEERLRSDPGTGLVVWLDYWFTAVSQLRSSTSSRLAKAITLPPEGVLLAERAVTAEAGLRQRNWHLAKPMLVAGIEGVTLADRTVPDEPFRIALRIVLLRLAIEL